MELSEKLTLASWFIVPAITTVVAYYQQRSAQRQLDEKTRLRDIHDLLDSLQQEEIRKETEIRLPDFWKEKLNKAKTKGETPKLLEVVLEEKRREIIKEWIKSGRIKEI